MVTRVTQTSLDGEHQSNRICLALVTKECIQAWLEGTTSIKATMAFGEGGKERHSLWSPNIWLRAQSSASCLAVTGRKFTKDKRFHDNRVSYRRVMWPHPRCRRVAAGVATRGKEAVAAKAGALICVCEECVGGCVRSCREGKARRLHKKVADRAAHTAPLLAKYTKRRLAQAKAEHSADT